MSDVPVSLHTGVPVEQLSVPVWQGLVGGHEAPLLQTPQTPLEQTWFVPQTKPSF
jgi:hypothetical protein